MMGINLHGVVRGAITAVHPDAPVTVLASACLLYTSRWS